MLVSAGAFAAVIYFSKAGQNEVEKEPVSQQASDEKDKNSGQEVSQETQNTEIDQKLEELTLQEKIAQMFMITPDALTGVDGTWNPGEVTETAF